MKFIYDAHEYSFNDETGELKNNYGEVVATIEDDETGEYYYADIPELDDLQQPPPIHVNVIQDKAEARGQWLVHTYVAAVT